MFNVFKHHFDELLINGLFHTSTYLLFIRVLIMPFYKIYSFVVLGRLFGLCFPILFSKYFRIFSE